MNKTIPCNLLKKQITEGKCIIGIDTSANNDCYCKADVSINKNGEICIDEKEANNEEILDILEPYGGKDYTVESVHSYFEEGGRWSDYIKKENNNE